MNEFDKVNLDKGSAEEVPAEEMLTDTAEAQTDTQAEYEAQTEETVQRVVARHQTASAAAINAEGEEMDIRRISGSQAPKKIKKSRISYERKKRLYGYGFIALWIIGTIYMFIIPLGQSIWFSLCKTDLVDANNIAQYGMSSPGIHCEWNNFQNYYDAFFTNEKFLPNLSESLTTMAPKVAMILVFSLFVAVLLNQKFKGRTVMRAIFFLPVLIATGPVISVINGDMLSQGVSDASQFSALFKTDFVDGFMNFIGMYNMPKEFTDTISEMTSDIFNLVWNAGIQIIIFLSALQTIPVSAKEAASMEGATGWEFFWKITFPTISPMILVNLIYSVIDSFIDFENPVMNQVITQAQMLNYGFSSALAWIYFIIVAAALAIIMGIASRFVFYQVD